MTTQLTAQAIGAPEYFEEDALALAMDYVIQHGLEHCLDDCEHAYKERLNNSMAIHWKNLLREANRVLVSEKLWDNSFIDLTLE